MGIQVRCISRASTRSEPRSASRAESKNSATKSKFAKQLNHAKFLGRKQEKGRGENLSLFMVRRRAADAGIETANRRPCFPRHRNHGGVTPALRAILATAWRPLPRYGLGAAPRGRPC